MGDFDLYGGSYIKSCDYGDMNMVDGSTYGKGMGMEVSYDDFGKNLGIFKAIVVEYTDFDRNTWNNLYYDQWVELYENKKLQ